MAREDKNTEAVKTLYQLPGWILHWFYATAIICTYDAGFILLRPHTLPGGSLHNLWRPYSLYITVDQRYADVNDPFVYGVALFNLEEVVLNVITIILHYKSSRHTVPLAFTVTVMTLWKTAFYFYCFTDLGGGAGYRVGNSAWEEFLLVLIPNGIWIVLPFLAIAALWTRMSPAHVTTQPLQSDWSGNYVGANDSTRGRVRENVLHAKRA